MFNRLWDAVTNARSSRRNKKNIRLLTAQLNRTNSQVVVTRDEKVRETSWAEKEAAIKAKMEKVKLAEQRRASRNIVISIIAITVFEVALFGLGMHVGKDSAPVTVREVIKTETVKDTSELEALNKQHADELAKLKADYESKIAALKPMPEPVKNASYVEGNRLFYAGKSLKLPAFIANCDPVFVSLTHIPASKMYSTGMDTVELHSTKADFSVDIIRNIVYRVRTGD